MFDCLPLRSIVRLDIPIDASPKYRARCERLKLALETHGSFNSYYLYNASCKWHFTNDPEEGMVEFGFEGTVLTDDTDAKAIGTNQVNLEAAQGLGIPVFNAPYSNTRSVAELVIAEAILLLRGVAEKNAAAHRGVWMKTAANSFEIRGKKLGIIGYGSIGMQPVSYTHLTLPTSDLV